MVPERDRKEVYDDVLFFLAKKEKVTVTGWIRQPLLLEASRVSASLWTPAIHCSTAPGSQLLPWKLVWHLHIPLLLLGTYSMGVGGQEGICEGLICNLCSFPFPGMRKS